MLFPFPIPFRDAIQKLLERGIVPSGMDSSQWREIETAIRERAFFSSRVESARVLQAMRDYLEEYLRVSRYAPTSQGPGALVSQGRAEFVADMRELAIREGLGRIDPATGRIDPHIKESDLTDIRSSARLQLIFDTQTESAQEHGYWKQGQSAAILDAFPCQQFIRVRPVAAPRPYHQAAEGAIRRKDDLPFWLSMNQDFGVPWGPWGYNSGMGVEDVDRNESIAAGAIREKDVVKPIEKDFNAGLAASVRDLTGGIPAALARITGGEIAGGRITARERVMDVAGNNMRLPGAMTPVDVPPRNAPASARLLEVDRHPYAADLSATLTVLDSIHDDGLLGMVELLATQGTKNIGEYAFDERTGRPLSMAVSVKSPWPELTLLHEIGHWMDQQVFGGRDGFGSGTGRWDAMAKLATKGATAAELRRMIRTEKSTPGGKRDIYPGTMDLIKIMARPEEIFARGYTEWICLESGHPRLLELLDYANRRTFGGYGLRGADREKFREIMVKELNKKGWK